MTTERLTDDELRALAADHAPRPVPPCSVCGAPRSIASCGGGEPTIWACSDRGIGPKHFLRSEYAESLRDPRVLAAVTELLERRAEHRHVVPGCIWTMDERGQPVWQCVEGCPDFDPFAQDPALGPVVYHADPAAPLEREDWPAAHEEN